MYAHSYLAQSVPSEVDNIYLFLLIKRKISNFFGSHKVLFINTFFKTIIGMMWE